MSRPAPNDIYIQDVDFVSLALQYPDFAKKLKPNRQLDFTDPESVRQLTLSLLHRDFNLALALPPDRLCPPVPNRFNYILHIQRLLDTTSPSFRDTFDPNRQVIGLDIGTGASCIYPLLACRQRERWKMLATEIDETSRAAAQQNIERNGLESRIRIAETDSTSRQIIPVNELERFERIDFLMTNPPFYSSKAQLIASAKSKSRPPNSSCTGAPIETIYPYPATTSPIDPQSVGGEVAFLSQILAESTQLPLRAKIQWFTGMLGHLSSLSTLITLLKSKGCDNYCVWEFVQGQKTRRWAVAWSWMSLRPTVAITRGMGGGLEKKVLPSIGEIEFEAAVEDQSNGLSLLGRRIDELLRELVDEDEEDEEGKEEEEEDRGMQWQWKPAHLIGVGMTWKGDCWSRKARRQKQHGYRRLQTHSTSNPNTTNTTSTSPNTNADVDTPMSYAQAPHNPGNPQLHAPLHSAQQEPTQTEPALVFKITLSQPSPPFLTNTNTDPYNNNNTNITPNNPPIATAAKTKAKVKIHIRHLQGHSTVLFESFCGWLRRKVLTSNSNLTPTTTDTDICNSTSIGK